MHQDRDPRSGWRAQLRGMAVVGACAVLSAPLLLATGSSGSVEDAVLAAARAQVGDAYAWGGNGPDAWDCSGLTSFAWREAGGVAVPRTSAAQQAWAVPLPAEQLLPGDLVFYGSPVTHVALYAGDGVVVDASSSGKGVLERRLWRAPVVRYGRVPRDGMPAVQPWASPTPTPTAAAGAGDGGAASVVGAGTPSTTPSPTPSAAPTAAPAAGPSATPSAVPSAVPAAGPAAGPAPAAGPDAAYREPSPLVAQAGLPARPAASTARALKAVRGARSVAGSRHYTTVGLVREAWRHAGGGLLPNDAAALLRRGKAVPLRAARVGDVVSYGGGARLYLYAGSGYMVGASPQHRGAVTVRRVHADPTLRLVRLPG